MLIDAETLALGRRTLARIEAGEVHVADCTPTEADAAEAALWVAIRSCERLLDSD